MRAYFWGNMYLSSIQQGIQSLHCVSEMFIKYPDLLTNINPSATQADDLNEWAKNHKTVVLLNAGESVSLRKIESLMQDESNEYAWASWCESDEALHGALTNVGIILPERIYKGAQNIKKNWRDRNLADKLGFNDFEKEIIELINTTYMAR